MQKNQGKLLEEDIRLNRFSLHQDLVDKQADSSDLPSDRMQLETMKSKEKSKYVFNDKLNQS